MSVEPYEPGGKLSYSSLTGGKRKRGNGHKAICGCPICKNMMAKKMKRGGSDDKSSSSDNVKQVGRQTKKLRGGKKSNGHKATCQCPICKNMRSARMSRRNKSRSNKRD